VSNVTSPIDVNALFVISAIDVFVLFVTSPIEFYVLFSLLLFKIIVFDYEQNKILRCLFNS